MNGCLAAILSTDAEPNRVVPTSAFSWSEQCTHCEIQQASKSSILGPYTWRADTSQWLPVAIDIARSYSLSCFGISLTLNALRLRGFTAG
jgi:hypothetical protein